MTDQLRTLAAAEAKNEFHPDRQPFNLYDARRSGYVRGFIAGRTSVTRESIARRLAAHSTGGVCAPNDPSLAWETWLSEADAVLALLNGGTDD